MEASIEAVQEYQSKPRDNQVHKQEGKWREEIVGYAMRFSQTEALPWCGLHCAKRGFALTVCSSDEHHLHIFITTWTLRAMPAE